jgi:hypothetical protein
MMYMYLGVSFQSTPLPLHLYPCLNSNTGAECNASQRREEMDLFQQDLDPI